MFQVCNGNGATGCSSVTRGTDSGSSLVDSGITPVAGTYYQLRVWHRMIGVGGAETIYMSINGAVASPGYKTFCASGCDGTLAHSPTLGGMSGQVVYYTAAASTPARSIDVDLMAYSITGLQLY
jgi:hypothetical protein